MRIALYSPLAPAERSSTPSAPCSPSPISSDHTDITSDIYRFLTNRRHQVEIASQIPGRDISWRPWRWSRVLWDRWSLSRRRPRPALWLTCHAGPKAPDVLGPAVTRRMDIPYVIFLCPGALANPPGAASTMSGRLAAASLLAAHHVFTHAREDLDTLLALASESVSVPIPVQATDSAPDLSYDPSHDPAFSTPSGPPAGDRITYIPPGIFPEDFPFDPEARTVLRESWETSFRVPVVLSAASFRPGAETKGLAVVIRICRELVARGRDMRLMIAGDGPERRAMEDLARSLPAGVVGFLGDVPRAAMHRIYSAADVFVPPGTGKIPEMMCLEAQCCGLPVVAWDHGGMSGVVRQNHTGLLTPPGDETALAEALDLLLTDKSRRDLMSERAAGHARERHDLNVNYLLLESRLRKIVEGGLGGKGTPSIPGQEANRQRDTESHRDVSQKRTNAGKIEPLR